MKELGVGRGHHLVVGSGMEHLALLSFFDFLPAEARLTSSLLLTSSVRFSRIDEAREATAAIPRYFRFPHSTPSHPGYSSPTPGSLRPSQSESSRSRPEPSRGGLFLETAPSAKPWQHLLARLGTLPLTACGIVRRAKEIPIRYHQNERWKHLLVYRLASPSATWRVP